ncbi:MAG: hypothetical protein AAGG51_23955 [Cyanobacteria bacterium P01_G01_bin.54]
MSEDLEQPTNPKAESGQKIEGIDDPPLTYFAVGATKFWIMSIATLNLYPAYWAYKNWMMIKRHTGRKMTAFWRAFFVGFTNWGLFHWIEASAKKQDIAVGWQVNTQASTFLGLIFLGRILDRIYAPLLFVGLLPPIAIMPVRKTIDALNQANDPEADLNRDMNIGNIAVIVFGAMLWLSLLIGLFIPEEILESRRSQPRPLTESITSVSPPQTQRK